MPSVRVHVRVQGSGEQTELVKKNMNRVLYFPELIELYIWEILMSAICIRGWFF